MTLDQQILAHAQAVAPRECCGLVVDTAEGLRYWPARNLAAGDEEFEVDPDDWIAAARAGEIVAVVHSHPGGPAVLSPGDRLGQRNTGLPYWLAVGDQVHRFRPVAPLLGRAFRHGEQDCYSLIRDACHLAGLELTDYPRADNWWDTEQDLYLDNIAREGFVQVGPLAPPQPGDVLLLRLVPGKVSHGAIYLGDDTILHHCPNRLSRRDMLSGTYRQRTHSIWRHQAWQQFDFTGIYNDLAASTGLTSAIPPRPSGG